MSESLPPVISPPEALTITYQLTRLDCLSTYFTIFLRNKVISVFVLVMLAFSLGSGYVSAVHDGLQPLVIFFSLLVEAAAIIFIMLVLQLIVGAAIIFLQHDAGLVGTHVLQITDEGLVESTAVNRGLHTWAGMHKIKSGIAYLYIYTGASRFFHVPRRHFKPGQLDDFERELQRRVAVAKQSAN